MFAKPSMHSQHHHSADGVRRRSPIYTNSGRLQSCKVAHLDASHNSFALPLPGRRDALMHLFQSMPLKVKIVWPIIAACSLSCVIRCHNLGQPICTMHLPMPPTVSEAAQIKLAKRLCCWESKVSCHTNVNELTWSGLPTQCI